MNVKKQLEKDSFKRASRLTPAKKILIAFDLSRLVFALSQAINPKKGCHERPRKRIQRTR